MKNQEDGASASELPVEVREAIAEAIGVFFEQTDDAEHCEHRICAALAPLWPKQPQPSADVEKEVAGARLNREAGELAAEVAQWRQRAERAEAAAHDYHKKACDIADQRDRAESERDQLRAEVEQWKTTAAKDREENVDMRNEIADLRAQLNELQRINQADYTEAGWQRARELEQQLAAAQEDSKRLDWLAMRWESQSRGPQTVSYTLVQVDGSFRSAIDAAMKEDARHA